ncbi:MULTISPECIES: cell envelope protein SmpA [unclassified Variovorax]|uniref:cell envelope protein SmpA n=1 Tax=unclassified Variovorax TaxID=663243 RepID=UPI001BD40738|nr:MULTISPECIES: cell envelope protein SmpA [unclassified Variovorax]
MLRRHALALAIAIAAPVSVAHAQRPGAPQGPLITGFLCCNMYTYGSQMGDGNYREEGTSLLPVGTPTQVTGYERHFIYLSVGGKTQRLKNDYSRDVALTPFAYRYVVNEDPRVRIGAFEPRVRDAILAARVTEGMTREQVTMAVGWPIASENPRLEADVWRYWIDSWSEYQVAFDKAGKVKGVTGTPAVLDRVLYTPPQ